MSLNEAGTSQGNGNPVNTIYLDAQGAFNLFLKISYKKKQEQHRFGDNIHSCISEFIRDHILCVMLNGKASR